ncbi:MAG: hypothetical protein EA397_18710 [Deltaproteobacteria bacterium]|nr:MAG: hypothetical protein EA397_18710 [Deltaproteobacteria bacterium]
MKVVCDNCGAMYKIPDEKLVKPVNKATCRQCGHRMLIPRPRRGADPDERTLVTAVPPTPAPPPARDDSSGSTTQPFFKDSALAEANEEKTMPVGSRPSADETRWIRNEIRPNPQQRTPSPSPRVSAGPRVGASAAVSAPPDRNAMTERVPAHGGAATPSQAPTPVPREPELDSGTPLPVDAISPSSDRGTPAPAKRKSAPKKHDPGTDMGLVLAAVVIATLGVVILGIDAVLDESGFYWLVMIGAWLGTTLAVSGLLAAFLLLLTSGRGRRPAWKVTSILVAVLLGLIAGGVPATVRVGVDGASTFSDSLSGLVANGYEEPPPTLGDLREPVADAETDADGAKDPEPEIDEDDQAEDAAEAKAASTPKPKPSTSAPTRTTTTAKATSAPAPTPTRVASRSTEPPPRSTSSAPAPRIIEDRTSEPPPPRREPPPPPIDEKELPDDLDLIASDPPPPARSNLPERPPPQAIDVMVKSNKNVKRCFFDYNRAEGKLPNRIDVPFTIKPNGDATDISVKQGRYAGGALEACLIKAIRGITFPPSQKGTTITFPFVFE